MAPVSFAHMLLSTQNPRNQPGIQTREPNHLWIIWVNTNLFKNMHVNVISTGVLSVLKCEFHISVLHNVRLMAGLEFIRNSVTCLKVCLFVEIANTLRFLHEMKLLEVNLT